MSKITEEYIFDFYMPLILHECRSSYKGLEWEDRIAEGGLALIYAIRTYKKEYGPFPDYMFMQLRKIVKQKNTEAWASKRLDSQISLDTPLNAGNPEFTLASCIESPPQDDSILDVERFINSLSGIERIILGFLIDGYILQSISDMICMPLPQVQSVLNRLKNKAINYFGKDILI